MWEERLFSHTPLQLPLYSLSAAFSVLPYFPFTFFPFSFLRFLFLSFLFSSSLSYFSFPNSSLSFSFSTFWSISRHACTPHIISWTHYTITTFLLHSSFLLSPFLPLPFLFITFSFFRFPFSLLTLPFVTLSDYPLFFSFPKARTPLIISRKGPAPTDKYITCAQIALNLFEGNAALNYHIYAFKSVY